MLGSWAGSGDGLQPVARQEVRRFEGGGICPEQLDHRGAGGLWSERLAEPARVLLLGLAAASSVGADRRPAKIGQRGDPWQYRGEGDAQFGAICLILGVGGDQALRGLGAGVSAAERRAGYRGTAAA